MDTNDQNLIDWNRYKDYIKTTLTQLISLYNREGKEPPLGKDDFEDLYQEMALKFLIGNFDKFEWRSRFTTYLYRTMINLLRDNVRKRRRGMGMGPSPVRNSNSPVKTREDLNINLNTDTVEERQRKKTPIHQMGPQKHPISGSDPEGMPDIHNRNSDPRVAMLQVVIDIINQHYKTDAVRAAEMKGRGFQDEIFAVIEAGLTALPDRKSKKKKTAIGMMYFCESLSEKEIARALNLSQSTVSEHITYLRKHLIENLKKNYADYLDYITGLC